ncbi:MAG: ParA family protein [Planctomycetes bacterium]|nr:ParA family protein [Planctomycetota bacterium]
MPEASSPRARVLTSLNLKGGVGKTHLCWLLASVCQERQLRCLIVDLDQQANITQSFLPDHVDPTGVEMIFEPGADIDPQVLVRRTAYDHVDVIPVTGHFARYDLSHPEHWEKQRLHAALADALSMLVTEYDYILLDCPPRISLASYAALCASDYVLIPLEAADWGARGTATVRAVIERVQQRDNPQLQLLGYVVSKFKRQRLFQGSYLRQIRDSFGEHVFDTLIPDSAQFERSVDDAIPITLHSPSSHAARIARRLFDECESRIGRAQEEHVGVRRRRRQSGAPAVRPTVARR